ncbi:MAG TPA: serine hydrolase domain-containing protein, partial [Gemmatimonadaceae bacterium]|nr:serine hydrolase domain-containing protein [Gemmatimonadaceae bacterium]
MTAAVSFGEQLHATMADYVRRRDVPGVVTLVSRHGRVRRPVQSAVVGVGTIGGPAIQRDAIFRVTSLSKPIISAAAMVLVDDGVLRLDEPVDRFLPELADRRVLHRLNSPLDDTVPAARPITVRDLLTSRMGFGIVMARAERYPIQRALRELEICVGPPNPQAPHTPDEWMRRLGMLPLMH